VEEVSLPLADAREAVKRSERAGVSTTTAETRALRDALRALLDWAEAADRRLADTAATAEHAYWLQQPIGGG
jgi:ubiquitin